MLIAEKEEFISENVPFRSVQEQVRPRYWVSSGLQSLELFTGAGGLALGTHLAGFHHQALLEWNQDACNTLRKNSACEAVPGISDWQILEADATTIQYADLGPIDLIAGGPPCQPFSIGGKHQAWHDDRDMIPEFVRAVRELAPRAFVLENVRGLLRTTFRTYFSYIVLQLSHPWLTRRPEESWQDHLVRLEDVHTSGRDTELQYNVVFRLLNAADYGVPQTRERVFVVGFRADTGIDWHFPEPRHSRESLLFEQWGSGEYWDRHKISPPGKSEMVSGNLDTKAFARPLIAPYPWLTIRDAISDLPEPSPEVDDIGIVTNHRARTGARVYKGHTGSPIDWPSKTLKAGDHGVPGGENMITFPDGSVRYLTVREAARVQTFPDHWHFEGAWSEAMRQLGNAVPVTLATVVASSVARKLSLADVNS